MEPVIDLYAVAYEAPKETARILESLQHVSVPFSLTVVENNSPNSDVRDLLFSSAFSDVKDLDMCQGDAQVVFNDENVGYARAVNSMVRRKGHAPYLAALNCDIAFEPGCVEKIVALFAEDAEVGVIGPRTTDSGNRLTHAGIVRDAGGRDLHRAWLVTDVGQFNDTLEVPTVSGATYFVRRTMWSQLTLCPLYQRAAPGAEGAFLPTPHFYEETWCSYHAWAHDWTVVYLGEAKMIHEWHKSSAVGSIRMSEAESQFRAACAVHNINLTF